jgi:drug/metabolite transporter (DMT)-like permease
MPIEPGIVAAIGSAAMWAMSSTVMASQSGKLDSGTISAIRLICASAFFAVVLFASGNQGDMLDMGIWNVVQLVLGAFLGLGIGDTLYVASLALVGMARAFTVSLGLFTVFAYTLSILLLGEEVTIWVILGSALVVCSVYIVSFRGRADPIPTGDLAPTVDKRKLVFGFALVVGVALCWAAATVWTRAVSEDYSAVAIGSVRLPAAAVMVGAFVAINAKSSVRRRTVPRKAIVLLSLSGIVGTGFGSLLYLYALQEAGAGKAAVLSSCSPLFALPLGAIFLGQAITKWVAVGTVIAVTGIVMLSF